MPKPCIYMHEVSALVLSVLFTIGRGIRVKVSSSNGSRLLKLAVEHARFDWVKWYGGYAYFCVIPDGKHKL